MATITGNVTQANGTAAHINLLDLIRQAAEATGNWTALRWDATVGELILKGNGYSSDKEIFIGFLCYQSGELDYYNISTAAFTGYAAGNSFATQPGYYASAVPAHATSIEYWINISPQRITGALRIAGVAWEFFYLGFFNPFSSPTAYPYPMLVAGMLTSATAGVRFSAATSSVSPLKSPSMRTRLRNNTEWIAPTFHPFNSPAFNSELSSYGVGKLRDIFGTIPLLPITLYTSLGCWGELEGVFFAPWFNASTGDIVTIADIDHMLVGNSLSALHDDGLMLRLD